MAKSRKLRFDIDVTKFERFLREGRGQGRGPTYRPWLQIDDLSSKGRSHRTACALTGFRMHHFLSDNEYLAFINCWWDLTVLDIREQYPLLTMEATMAYASHLGVRHPYNPRTKMHIAQTTDLLLSTTLGLVAGAVKEDVDIAKARTKEKLEIAKVFWGHRDVPTREILRSEVKCQRSENLMWIYDARPRLADKPFSYGQNRVSDYIVDRVYRGGEVSSTELRRTGDIRLGATGGTTIAAIRSLLAQRVLLTDIEAGDVARDCILRLGGVPIWR